MKGFDILHKILYWPLNDGDHPKSQEIQGAILRIKVVSIGNFAVAGFLYYKGIGNPAVMYFLATVALAAIFGVHYYRKWRSLKGKPSD